MDSAVSRGGRLQFLVIAVLILILPFGWYYFVYVSSQKAYLTDRNFRLLGLTSQEIQARIEYLNLSWNQMTEEFSKDVEERPTETLENFEKDAQRRATELINLISGLEKNSTKVELKTFEQPEKEKMDSNSLLSFEVERKRDTVIASFHYQHPDPIELKGKKSNDKALFTSLVRTGPEFSGQLDETWS